MKQFTPKKIECSLLFAGDMLCLVVVTIYGFATHGTLDTAGMRMMTTFLPLAAAWVLTAVMLGLYEVDQARKPLQLWKLLPAVILAAPLAGVLRAAWLNAPVLPLFILVLGGAGGLALLAWRILFLIWRRPRS